jgi:hypothetical protein
MVAPIKQISTERRPPHTLWVVARRSTTNERLVDALDACGVSR